jgi:hypothetical protein
MEAGTLVGWSLAAMPGNNVVAAAAAPSPKTSRRVTMLLLDEMPETSKA